MDPFMGAPRPTGPRTAKLYMWRAGHGYNCEVEVIKTPNTGVRPGALGLGTI